MYCECDEQKTNLLGLGLIQEDAVFLLLHMNRFKKRSHYGKTRIFQKATRETSGGSEVKQALVRTLSQESEYKFFEFEFMTEPDNLQHKVNLYRRFGSAAFV